LLETRNIIPKLLLNLQASNRMSTLHDFGFVAFDLKYTRPDDTGSYTCKASNSLGEAVISANLVVTKLLRITKDILSHLRLR